MENILIKEFEKTVPAKNSKNGTISINNTYIQFKCFHCNDIVEMRKVSYVHTKPCKQCQKRLRGKQTFFKKAAEKFGDAFDLTKAEAEYFDATTHVTVRCKKHDHEYSVSPVRFTAKPYPNQPAKGGCPKCAHEVQLTKNKQSIDYYLAIIENSYPDLSIIAHGNACSNLEPIYLKCPIHGEFKKSLAKVLQSTKKGSKLCDKCTSEAHAWRTRMARTDIPGKVYFVHFKDVDLYKCGVTHKTTKERLRGHLSNINILWELDFPTLSQAYTFEYLFFRYYYSLKCNHPDTTLGGYTEFFYSYIEKPLQPFIEEILCRKESNSGKLPPPSEDNPERSLYGGTCNDYPERE